MADNPENGTIEDYTLQTDVDTIDGVDIPVYEETRHEQKPRRWTRFFWQGKLAPAFWTITGIISITVNIILIVALILIGQQLFTLKDVVENQLVSGLHSNFVAMDDASIVTNVQVEESIPVKFDLQVQADTSVVLTEPTPIDGASVVISTSVLNINAPANIVLPAGLELPISMDITVPVDKEIPVVLNVPVNIPLSETELHEPFVGLQEVVGPYKVLLDDLPDEWKEIPLCQGRLSEICILAFEP